LKFVDNGVPEDFARLTFEGMTVPLCELTDEEYMEVVYGIKGYKKRRPRGGAVVLPEEPEPVNKVYDQPIDILELSVRASNCLARASITTIGELCALTEAQVARTRNMGAKSVKEV